MREFEVDKRGDVALNGGPPLLCGGGHSVQACSHTVGKASRHLQSDSRAKRNGTFWR